VNRFLIVRLGALGDIVHGIPVAAALRNQYPQAHIDWLVDARYLPLLDLVQCLDRRIPIDPRDLRRGRARRSGFLEIVRELREAQYDACIDLQGLLKSAMLARAVRAGRTIGFPRRHLREGMARLFYTDAPDPGTARHVIDKGLALLAPLGVDDLRVHFPIGIPRTPAVESVIGRFPGGYAIINPCAAWPNKRWPPERYGAVASAVRVQFGVPSIVLWGPGEQPLASAVAAASLGAAEVAPPTSVPDVIGLARHARLMISGDTGPLHLAAAVGTPIVALFGPTQPERNGPWSPLDISISRAAQCSCLYERRCRRKTPCIDDIATDEVIDAARLRLDPWLM
jgi:lipopolysaccharide heptosyltransferase I